MIVDVHGHVTHPELFEKFPMPPALADIEGMLERKAEAGIGMTIVGSPVGFGTMMPVPGLDNYAQPADRLRSFHEWLAETVREHDGKLAAYCYTNPFDPSLNDQTAETVREGGFVGLIVNTSVKGRYLDDPGADEFFAMAAELGVPIFLHPPAAPVGADSVEDFRLVEQVGRFLDVTMCLATLIFSGRLERDPNLKVLAATAGGAIGLLTGRLDSAYAPLHHGGPPPDNKISRPPSEFLSQVYVDTANSSPHNHLSNLQALGASNLLFGTDSPPLSTPLEAAIAMVHELPVDEAQQQGILEGNAKRLFGLDDA